MVRQIKFIWYSMSYQQLKEVLKDNRSIGSFPIVDSPDGMILLGSIPRQHLIKVHIKKYTQPASPTPSCTLKKFECIIILILRLLKDTLDVKEESKLLHNGDGMPWRKQGLKRSVDVRSKCSNADPPGLR